jgi:hypothetical protein
MGQGEAACVAMAAAGGWMVASDERRQFRREVVARLGEGHLIFPEDGFVRERMLLIVLSRCAPFPEVFGQVRPLTRTAARGCCGKRAFALPIFSAWCK